MTPQLCECGCGGFVSIPLKTNKKLGRFKGQPMRFISGHNSCKGELSHLWRGGRYKHSNGHVVVRSANHPRAHNGCVFEHILLAEKALGKTLPPKVVVHHHDPEQLVVCQDQGYHMLLHKRQRALKACGNANWRPCRICHKYDDPQNMYGYRGSYRHRECHAEKEKLRQREISTLADINEDNIGELEELLATYPK